MSNWYSVLTYRANQRYIIGSTNSCNIFERISSENKKWDTAGLMRKLGWIFIDLKIRKMAKMLVEKFLSHIYIASRYMFHKNTPLHFVARITKAGILRGTSFNHAPLSICTETQDWRVGHQKSTPNHPKGMLLYGRGGFPVLYDHILLYYIVPYFFYNWWVF